MKLLWSHSIAGLDIDKCVAAATGSADPVSLGSMSSCDSRAKI